MQKLGFLALLLVFLTGCAQYDNKRGVEVSWSPEAIGSFEPGVTTRSGAGVGSSIPELQALFGDRLRVTEDEDGSTTATFVPTDPEDANYRIIFESSDGTVSAYRSGRLPVVRDGC